MVGHKICALLACAVIMADIVYPVGTTCGTTTLPTTEPAPVVVEQTLPTTELTDWAEPETQAPIDPVTDMTMIYVDDWVMYSVHGHTPRYEWQRYLWDELDARGYSWYYPYAICQIWQESCWNETSSNGRDFGLTQQKGIYWDDRAAYWGVPGADIWDPYAQLHVYACMMCGYLAESGGDVGRALSAYYLGTWDYSQTYVGHVMSHWDALEVVR